MATWPLLDSGLGAQTNVDLATSLARATVTGSATIHTKGPWTEIVASTDYDCHLLVIEIWFSNTSSADTSILLDIGVGAAAAETVILPDVCGGFGGGVLIVPLRVPAGTRLSARLQSLVASKTARVTVRLIHGGGVTPLETLSRATTYGANAATSTGVLLTAPGAINTKGAWTQIAASTTAPGRWCLVTVQGSSAAIVGADMLIDIGVGAAAAETVILANMQANVSTAEVITYVPGSAPVYVPAGTRLSARYQASSIGASNIPAVVVTLLD